MTGSTFGWVGQHQKQSEASFALQPTQMGVRIYLAKLGRFTQVDPVEGGTPNNYVYPTDPVNDQDLTGMCPWCVVIVWAALRAYPYVHMALIEANAGVGGVGSKWSKGSASSNTRNLERHYIKHAKEIGAKDAKLYHNSAQKTIVNYTKRHTYRNGNIAYRDKQGRITVTNSRGQLVTHFKPKNTDKYWETNIKRR